VFILQADHEIYSLEALNLSIWTHLVFEISERNVSTISQQLQVCHAASSAIEITVLAWKETRVDASNKDINEIEEG
jgi:hypothetical protein